MYVREGDKKEGMWKKLYMCIEEIYRSLGYSVDSG